MFGLGVHVDSGRVWALPVLFRLFRTQADCQKTGGKHLEKTQLARQLVEQVKRWLPDKPVDLVADSAYSQPLHRLGRVARELEAEL